jgi:hypothetical protein
MDPDEFLASRRAELRNEDRRKRAIAWGGIVLVLGVALALILFGIWNLGGLDYERGESGNSIPWVHGLPYAWPPLWWPLL